MAKSTVNLKDKAQWLTMGETWMRMAHQVESVLPSSRISEPLIGPDVPGEPDGAVLSPRQLS